MAFHCTKRAGGHSVLLPGLEYGPNQRDHSFPGSSVLPERAKNSRRGELDDAEDLPAGLSAAAGGGLHQSRRPHWEKSCASKERDSYVPSGSYSGPTEKTFPGFAVQRKSLPPALRAMPVICAEPALASCANTPRPSMARSAPLLPVPASRRPSELRASE